MVLFSEIQQQQHNDSETTSYNREEEYRRAQQAAVEAVMVGRETLATTVQQGEQLQHAETLADETEYTVDKANRLLRGMTWSGWLANKLSKDVDSPEYRNNNNNNDDTNKRMSILGPPKAYAMVPESCAAVSQSVQNYHLNLQVLENCETDEQKGTCRLICNDMHRQARLKINDLLTATKRKNNNRNDDDTTNDDDKSEYFVLQLQEDVSSLRQRQFVLQQVQRGMTTTTTGDEKTNIFNKNTAINDTVIDNPSSTDAVTIQQEQHLNTITQHLQELGSLAGNLNISLHQQAEVIDSLDTKNETLHFKTNTMNRRTERFIKDKSWKQQKAEFSHYAWIRHQISGRYLSIAPNNNDSTLMLSNVLNERCIFGIWKRKRVFGLQNKYSRRWVGQSLLGQLTCSASAFNRREEWEADGDDWSDTTLLIVSAGWGTGGYLLLDKEGKGTQPIIGGGDLAIKKQAPKWCISLIHEE